MNGLIRQVDEGLGSGMDLDQVKEVGLNNQQNLKDFIIPIQNHISFHGNAYEKNVQPEKAWAYCYGLVLYVQKLW